MNKFYKISDFFKRITLSNNLYNSPIQIESDLRKKNRTLFSAIVLILFLAISIQSSGQSIANYTFSTNTSGSMLLTSTGEDVDMTFGTALLHGSGVDDANSVLTDIGFNFFFMGSPYTQFSASSNGRISLGSIAGSNQGNALGTALIPHITPFGGDMSTILAPSVGSKVHSKTFGNAPNRVLVVEWTNMKIAFNNANNPAIAVGDGTFQVLIYESNASVEFKYAKMTVATPLTGGAAIGLSAGNGVNQVVSVVSATNLATNSGSYQANIYATGNILNLNSSADGSRRVYAFTPGPPAEDPIALTYTFVTQTATTINWIDNSTSEGWFIVTRSTNPLFTDNVVATRVNSTSTPSIGAGYNLAQSGLLPGVTYYYRIQSGNEGFELSLGATGQQITLPPTANNSVASGLWNNPLTWSTGIVPTNLDNVTITAGQTVTCNVSSIINAITINGNLIFDANVARNLVVTSDVIVNATSSFRSANTGSITSHSLVLGGSLINNGTIDFSSSSNATGATITFNSVSNTNFSLGVGSVTNLRNLSGVVVSKGTSIASVLTFNPRGALTVQGSTTQGFLTISNGLLQITGSNTFSSPLFSSPNYIIPATGGFRLNNANATIVGLNGSPTNNGLFNIMAGTFNIGTAANNSLGFGANSTITISGGTINSTSRFGVNNANNRIIYTQSGGTINVNSIENNSPLLASFDLGTALTSLVNITGGTVNVVLQSIAGTGPRDVRGANLTASSVLTGGSFRFGTAASGTSNNYFLSGALPSVSINNSSAFHNISCSANTQVFSSVTIPLGSILNLNGFSFINTGATLTNNGTITGTGASNLSFSNTTIAQNFTGTGLVTPGLSILSIDKGSTSLTLNPSMTGFSLLRVNLISGTIVNSNKLTIGTGATANCLIQIGSNTNTFAGGNFDVAPNWNLGTADFAVQYLSEVSTRTTGREIPPSRIVNQFTVSNLNGLIIAGGPIDIVNLFNLTSGIIQTTAVNILRLGEVVNVFGTLSNTSMVSGPISRTIAANRTAAGNFINAQTLFPVGKGGVYMPISIDATTGAGPVTFTSESFLTNAGSNGSTTSSLSLNRFQAIITNGASNFVSAFVRISDPAIVVPNKTLQAIAANGVYNPVANPVTFTTATLSTATPILATDFTGYFAYGNTISCVAPANQPTALLSAGKTTFSINLNFTAATSAPSGYLIVRYPAGTVPDLDPVNFVNYLTNNPIGNGIVVYSGPNLFANAFTLQPNTTYDFRVFSYNNSGCDGPLYNVNNPLTGTFSTCSAIIGNTGPPVVSNISTNSFTATWTPSLTPSVTYLVDVATNNTFTNFVLGYQNFNAGTGLSVNITGLELGTSYFLRVRAVQSECVSGNSPVLNVSTLCNPSGLPYSQNFELAVVPNLPLCTVNVNAGSGSNWTTGIQNGNGFSSRVLRYNFSTTNAADTWFITNGLNLVAGSTYAISFRYGNNNPTYTEKLRVAVGNAPTVPAMTQTPSNILGNYPNINTATAQTSKVFFTPPTTGSYFFGFNAYSDADQFTLFVDDILVETGCSGTPQGGTTVATSTSICSTGSVTLSLQNSTVSSSLFYQWQRSPDGIAPFVAIPLENNPTLVTSIAGSYRCVVSCGVNASISTAILISVAATVPPPVALNQTLCSGSTLQSISVTGSNIKWYTSATASVALNSTSVAIAGTFFASQTIGSCESATRTPVTITLDNCTISFANVQSPGISSILSCQNQTFKARVFKTGITEAAGAGPGIVSWFAVSTTNTNPATWAESEWQLGTFSAQVGNDDEYQFTTNGLSEGTYFVATRFQYTTNPASGGPFVYGGFNSAGGAFWNGTSSVSARLTVTAVARPNALGVQTFCNAATVANLTATGTAIKWYTTATGGTALSTSAPLVSGNYYATQTVGGCESPARLLVVVAINSTAAPIAGSQTLCDNATVANLTATGLNIKWYTTATLGTALAPAAVLTNGNYFASQTIGTCESVSRTLIVVTVTNCAISFANLQSPGVSSINTCQNQTFAARVFKQGVTEAPGAAPGITAWIGISNSNSDPSTWPSSAWILAAYNAQVVNNDEYQITTNALSSGIYYVASRFQFAANANAVGLFVYGGFNNAGGGLWNGTSNINALLTVNTVLAPTANSSQVFCNSGTVADLQASGSGIKWYTTSTGGVALASTLSLVNGNYFASQTIGTCESLGRALVSVTINTPAVPIASAQTFCNTGTVANLIATGSGIKWYATATATTPLATSALLVSGNYFASQTISGCESLARTSVAVTVNIPAAPLAVAQSFCNAGTVANLVATGTGIKWYASLTGGTALASTTPLTTNTYFVSQTIGTCESLVRTAVAVTIVIPSAPVALAQSFCNTGTVANLVATGTEIKWYLAATGGSALSTTLNLVSGNYFASQTVNNCESIGRTLVAVTINIPVAPTANTSQVFCNSGTVADLQASGSGIKWYTTSTGGVALASNLSLVNGNYFASQTIGTCESLGRASVSVTINTPAAPIASAQTFCNTGTVANLIATGSGIKWYATATASTPLATSALLVSGTYFASQTISGCESLARTSVAVTVNVPAAPLAVAQSFCNAGTVANLVATGTGIKWYASLTGGTVLASTTPLTATTYFVSQTIGTCESLVRTAVAVTIVTPSAPVALTQSFCNSGTVANLVATGTEIKWYSTATGGSALSTTLNLVSGNYFASQTVNDCESIGRTLVAVTINTPVAPTANSSQVFCNSGTVADLQASGSGIKWYATSTGGVALASTLSLVNGNYFASQTIGTCESLIRASVSVIISTPAAPIASAQTFCNTGTVANLVATGSGIKWYATATASTPLAISALLVSGNYFASQTISGCESLVRTSVAVTINVPAPPLAVAEQSFCTSGIVGDLVALGTGIKWYTTATLGIPLIPSTALVAGNYFASQTIGNCESISRTLVAVTLNGVLAPQASAQSLCNSGTVADLVATGSGIKWYTTATLGTALSASTILVSGNYFASQTVGSCESISRTLVPVTLNGLTAPIATNQTLCNSGTVADLIATGIGIKWYTTATSGTALPISTVLVAGNYFAAQSSGTCESATRTLIVVSLTNILPPAATAQSFCNAATIGDLNATGTNVKWYVSATAASPLIATTPLLSGTYFASQTVGTCESVARTLVTVTITNIAAPIASSQNFCNSGTVADLTAVGAGIKWYSSATSSAALLSTTTLIAGNYFASQTIGACESVSRTLVSVILNAIAPPSGANVQSFTLSSTAAPKTIGDLVATGTNVQWFASIANALANTNPLSLSVNVVNNTTYYAMQTIGTCRSGEPLAVLVTVILGINEFEFSDLEVYPNPVTRELTLRNSNTIFSATIFNLLGQKVLSASPNALISKLDMSSLPAGTYLVHIVGETKVKIVKVVKK